MQSHQGRIDNMVSQRDHSGQDLSQNGLSRSHAMCRILHCGDVLGSGELS